MWECPTLCTYSYIFVDIADEIIDELINFKTDVERQK